MSILELATETYSISVVFSQWTYTLDLVQSLLQENGMKYTRMDGKTSLPKRNAAVRAFQTDDSVRIILVSITCGGTGYVHPFTVTFQYLQNYSIDLTAGSRAYLLEPHWNPMIEEQALCRIHRVGQRREVTTIRYLMRDSCEEVTPFLYIYPFFG
jgi:SNF2 family DNA or RNA helicase